MTEEQPKTRKAKAEATDSLHATSDFDFDDMLRPLEQEISEKGTMDRDMSIKVMYQHSSVIIHPSI